MEKKSAPAKKKPAPAKKATEKKRKYRPAAKPTLDLIPGLPVDTNAIAARMGRTRTRTKRILDKNGVPFSVFGGRRCYREEDVKEFLAKYSATK